MSQPQLPQSRRAEQIARRAVRRIITDNAPATDPIPIVETLRGTPYSRPVTADKPGDEEARMILEFAVDVGKIMLRAGAGTSDVEITAIAACTSCGLHNAEVDLTYQSLTLFYRTDSGQPLTVMGVNRGESLNFARLRAVHALITDLVEGNLGFTDARARLDAIKTQKRPFPQWMASVAWGVLAGGVVILLGGSPLSALLGALVTITTDFVGRTLAKTGMPFFFVVLIMTMGNMLLAMLLREFNLVPNPQYLVAAGIVVLLPTISLFAAVQDSLTNFPLTAAGRMVNVMMVFAAIIGGVATGLLMGRAFGLMEVDVVVDSREFPFVSVVFYILTAAIIAAAGAVAQQVSRRLILPSAIVGALGYAVSLLLTNFGWGTILTSFVAAAVVAVVARPLALRLGAPPIAMIIPGIFPLLSGLSIFSATYQLVQPLEAIPLATAATNLVLAIVMNAALAVGAVFGNYLAQPLRTRRKNPTDRIRALGS